jgi:release factor glutamine methyltransferase
MCPSAGHPNEPHIAVIEDVYPPSEDSYLALSMLKQLMEGEFRNRKGLRVLDLGTGTGILGINLALYANVEYVVLSDISESAVRNANLNAKNNSSALHTIPHIIQSDLFSEIAGRFDLIVFNPPYLPESGEIADRKIAIQVESGPGGNETIRRFLKAAPEHLVPGGKIITVSSSLADSKELHEIISALGLEMEKAEKLHIFFEDIIAYLLSSQTSLRKP